MTKGNIKIDYDPSVDMMYIRIAEGKYKRSKSGGEGVLADVNSKGKILGFEIFDASKTTPELVKQFGKPKRRKVINFAAA